MDAPVRETYAQLGGDNGLEGRATSCARGSAMLEQMHSPYRVLQPLKRVGGRGEGKWQTISFEQLVQEVCEGGDLFGEGHVDGLRAIFDRDTPLDPANPEMAPRSTSSCSPMPPTKAARRSSSALPASRSAPSISATMVLIAGRASASARARRWAT